MKVLDEEQTLHFIQDGVPREKLECNTKKSNDEHNTNNQNDKNNSHKESNEYNSINRNNGNIIVLERMKIMEGMIWASEKIGIMKTIRGA